MAGLCAFLFPGLGHLVIAKPLQALLWFVVIVLGYCAFVVPGVLLHLMSVVDAARAEQRRTVQTLRKYR